LILGIGTDITSIDRIEALLAKQGERFLDRCFTPAERAHVEAAAKGDIKRRAAGYAKRWAAKEACAKALGLGIREHIFLKDIAVTNDTAGAPALDLTGGAKERLTSITPPGKTARTLLSLSDEPPMALAFVVVSAG
jgi:holo-[acyl-carrier protein] synthase